MKQIAQNYRTGDLSLLDVAEPSSRRGGLLVATEYSLISAGTEMMKVGEASMSLLGKARARPDQVRKVAETARTLGPRAAMTKALNRLDSYSPLGYSLAGTVVDVGSDVEGFRIGDRVACAGNQFAVHAETNWVPVNLCAKLPDSVSSQDAAFTTCGSIAMQALRQSEAGLGDVAVIVGLGLIGQLLSQLLVAAGVTVVGIDLADERCTLAVQRGARFAGSVDGDGTSPVHRAVAEASNGAGADLVFLAAGGSSNSPVELAAELARDRGRVVDIGKCSLDLPWDRYYEKELEVRFSRSYGPGRYDDNYEQRGIDYPIGYVRWTEQRNMACFVDLLERGAIDVGPLIAAVEPFSEAPSVYERLSNGSIKGIGFLFRYPAADAPARRNSDTPTPTAPGPSPARVVELPPHRPRPMVTSPVGVAFIGAGNYAKTMLLPHLAGRDDVALRQVVTSTPLSASTAASKFGFEQTGTDADTVWADESIDAVFVVTRHSSHVGLVCAALEAGKAVYVEKPLAIDLDGLRQVTETVRRTGNDRLHVGFNRRFAPMATFLHDHAAPHGTHGRTHARYLVNAGTLDPGSWYLGSDEGSRFVGEGGHFVDTMSWWLGGDPTHVAAVPLGEDGISITLEYPGGSTAQISYVTDGAERFPKETFDALGAGRAARLDNFVAAKAWDGRRVRRRRAVTADKGQQAQLGAFLSSLRRGTVMPISFDSIAATTAATILAPRAAVDGCRHDVAGVLR